MGAPQRVLTGGRGLRSDSCPGGKSARFPLTLPILKATLLAETGEIPLPVFAFFQGGAAGRRPGERQISGEVRMMAVTTTSLGSILQVVVIYRTGAEERDAKQVREYHLSLGWRDLGYHFLIERDGTVVRGRGLDLPGANCTAAGMNRRGIGVALLGNLEEHPPTEAQLGALVRFLRCLSANFDILPENVLGHREVPGAATLCPGKHLDMGGSGGRWRAEGRTSAPREWVNAGPPPISFCCAPGSGLPPDEAGFSSPGGEQMR